MIHLGRFCFVCLKGRQKLKKLSLIPKNGLSYLEKLTVLIPQLVIDEIKDVVYMCEECRIRINDIYNFYETCLYNNIILRKYITNLRTDKNKKFTDSIVLNKLNETQIHRYRDDRDDSRLIDFEKIHIKSESIDEIESSTVVLNNEQQLINNPININIKQEIEMPSDDFCENNSMVNSEDDVTTDFESIDDPILPKHELNKEQQLINGQLNINIKSEVPDDHLYENNTTINIAGDTIIHENKKVKNEDMSSLHTEFDIKYVKNNGHCNQVNIKDNCCSKTNETNVNKNINPVVSSVNIRDIKIHENKPVKNEELSSLHTEFIIQPIKTEESDNEINRENNRLEISNSNLNEKAGVNITEKSEMNTNTNTESFNRIHNNEKPFKCEICNTSFTKNNDLTLHKIIHTNEKPHKCGICKKSFNEKNTLINHRKIHTSDRPHKCEICNKSFITSAALKKHIKLHSNIKPYKCEICDKSFIKNYNLTAHKKIHTNQKPHKCQVCNKSFLVLTNFKRHIRIHTGEKPYKCDICNKSFIYQDTLKNHHKIHAGEKAFQCEICNKSFVRKTDLKTHFRIHTGEKPYKCKFCNKSFYTSCALKPHVRTHTGEKPYQCELCDKSFATNSNLTTHKKKHHDQCTNDTNKGYINVLNPYVPGHIWTENQIC